MEIGGQHVDELELCGACARGDAGAIAAFEQRYFSEVAPAARRVSGLSHGVDDLKQLLRQRLFVAEPGGQPKICEYSGKGPLRAWLRVVIARMLLNLARGPRREEPLDGEAVREQLLVSSHPELQHLEDGLKPHFARAFGQAWAALDAEERLLLRQQYVDDLTLDELARLHKVHAATVSRRLARARAALLAGVREQMTKHLKLSPHEVTSLIRAVRGGLEISLRSLKGA